MFYDEYCMEMVRNAKAAGLDNETTCLSLFKRIRKGSATDASPLQRKRAEEARQKLVLSLAPLVFSVCKKYAFASEDGSDAFVDGLSLASEKLDKWEPAKGPLSSFVYPYVKGEVLARLNTGRWPGMTKSEIRDMLAINRNEGGDVPAGLTKARVSKVLAKAAMIPVSIDSRVYGESEVALSDLLASADPQPIHEILEGAARADLYDVLSRKAKTPRDVDILKLIVGACKGTDVAKKYGLTPARVSQLKSTMLNDMRAELVDKHHLRLRL